MADSKMDEATLEALRGSIAKWEGIVAGTMVDKGMDNCPLCALFNPLIEGSRNYSGPETCSGCPVMERTMLRFCAGTPYEPFDNCDVEEGTHEYIGAAKRELDFLKSLLPLSP